MDQELRKTSGLSPATDYEAYMIMQGLVRSILIPLNMVGLLSPSVSLQL
jgi:hypothetical protein